MTNLQTPVSLISVLLVICLAGETQEKPTGNNLSSTTVEFLFSARSKKEGPGYRVTISDLSFLDDGQKQNLTGLMHAENLPLTLGILLDGSLGNRVYADVVAIAEEQSCISEFLKASIREQDKSLWIRFAEKSPNLAGLIQLSDRAGMQQAVDAGWSPGAGTEVSQAVDMYRGESARVQLGRRALVIIANGGTFLGPTVSKRIVEIALREKIIVHVINAYTGPAPWGPKGPGERSLPRTDLPRLLNGLAGSIRQSLMDLARDTGGIYVEATDRGSMRKALSQLQEQLSGQYIATYSASAVQREGQFHNVQLRAIDRNITFQAPKGYYAPSH